MKSCPQMFIAALLLKVVIKRRSLYVHTVQYCAAKQKARRELLIHAIAWMSIKNMLDARSLAQNSISSIPFM